VEPCAVSARKDDAKHIRAGKYKHKGRAIPIANIPAMIFVVADLTSRLRRCSSISARL
jgi:hypothetical protein